ncbi:glycosyltransferase [Natronoflexus pectinivorans]|uniref:Cellulose synthase/poly-beta-1,6-N-acetylglucosamine synthase-like glycosyltransferase n=1 Tax=Natronoflexus pectinivorans TaxID=682526 RepID=A0A4R2GNF6_9BACT|nr:glycosyltransferase [Natronoflexus pectinivorans]TCO10844.1 cellulose synthase/poly-beta-1,6-N-acetylglucosamine synthase-like glycosyltransferase [Natronoflexus pectinivorans]
MMEILLPGIIVSYALVILLLRYGWYSKADIEYKDVNCNLFISVIIPFKNEAENLPLILRQIEKQSLPSEKFELILVNDHSTDDWHQRILNLSNLKIINSQNCGKKAAIATGIDQAQGQYIVTADADCVMGEEWLESIAKWIRLTNADMLAGPVTIESDGSFIQDFQAIDYYALQICGAGAIQLGHPLYCSGANLVFKKNRWIELNGKQDGKHIASGDDVFLMHAFKTAGLKIDFLKSSKALVYTRALSEWSMVLRQRSRWGGKTTTYSDLSSKILAVLVLFTNLSLLIQLFLIPFYTQFIPILLSSFIIKYAADVLILSSGKGFFHVKLKHKRTLVFSVLHPFWIVLAAFHGFFRSDSWD